MINNSEMSVRTIEQSAAPFEEAQDPNDQPISICFVIASITTDRAGTEGHLLRLIRGLDRKRFRPLLVVLQSSPWTDQFDDPDVPMQVLNFVSFLRPSDWKCIWQLAKTLKTQSVQIVETHFPEAHFVATHAAKLAGVSLVIGNRRDLVDQYSRKDLFLCRLANRLTTLQLANSEAVASVCASVESLPRSQIEVIHNGVDVDAYLQAFTNSTNREFQNAVSRGRVVILVANLTPIKNIAMFVAAAGMVSKRFENVTFAVLGSGPEEQRLRDQATDCGVENRFIWAGRVNDVRPYLMQSTIGCLTSDSEGLSNAVLEYMAAGLPVVATHVGGADEAVIDGLTGYLVEKNQPEQLVDRLSRLLSDPKLCSTMGNKGRQRAQEQFSFVSQIQAHQCLYQRLASSVSIPQPGRLKFNS